MPGTDLRLYNDIYAACAYPPLYASPWWLNAICGQGGWDAVPLTSEDGNTTGMIPYYQTRIRGLSALITPPMTQWLPVLRANNTNGFSLSGFLQSLPECPILDITIKSGEISAPYPNSFHVNLKYSFVIPYDALNENVKLKYNEGLRRNLKEAVTKYTIAVSDDIQTFVRLCQSSYHHRKMKPPPWLDSIVPDVVEALKKNRSGMMHMAFHKGVAIAGILTGWDVQTTYYLCGGRRSDEQGASAHALLLDHAISEAQQRHQKFDFEGSMNPGIANFFQSFGAVPEGYWQIRRFRGVGRLWSMFH